MIIKLNRKEWDDNRTNTTIANEVKKHINGNTPENLICETSIVGEYVIVNVKNCEFETLKL